VTSTRDRQRAAARARLEKAMAERASQARRRRKTQAVLGAGLALLLVVGGTVWMVAALGGDDETETPTASSPATSTQCAWSEMPKEGRPEQIKDVGLPPETASTVGTQDMTIDTNLGQIGVRVNLADTPCTAASFTHLAANGFFDGSKCHRLVAEENFKVLQCGDPSVTGKKWTELDGTGGPSYRFMEENLPVDKRPPYPAGVIAMANTGQPGSTGSQFFIVYGDSELGPDYTVLGTITEGMDIVEEVGAAGHDNAFAEQAGGGHPKKQVVIKTLTMSQPKS